MSQLIAVVNSTVGYRQEANLLRSHPGRQCACIGFDEVCQSTLVAAQGSTVNDIRQFLLAVLINIVHTEFFCQQHINLNSNDGIFFAEYVVELDIQLRTVESSLVKANLIFNTEVIKDFLHSSLCMIPLLSGAFIFVVRICRIPLAEAEGAFIQHADSFQAVFSQIQATLKFFFQLVRTKNQMAFGNSELTHTNQAVHFAAVLVTEQSRGFAQAHRQLTIGTLTVQENLILERAGHRTQSEAFFSFVMRVAQDEHAVKIMIPVTGNAVQVAFCHQRSLGQQIAAFLFHILNPTLQQLDYTCTFRQQDRQTLADIINSSEVFQITAQFVMVTL